MKLIKWLVNQADDVAASADDLKRYGPQAARVRAVMEFIPKMSDDATRASRAAYDATDNAAYYAAKDAAWNAAIHDARNPAYNAARRAAWDAAGDAAWNAAIHDARNPAYNAARRVAWDAAGDAGGVDVVSDLISPEHYRILTNPLATGRAVDVLGSRPRNQGLPFYDIVRQLGESGVLRTPRDVVIASRLAKAPDNVREVASFLMNNNTSGMTLQDILTNARLLA